MLLQICFERIRLGKVRKHLPSGNLVLLSRKAVTTTAPISKLPNHLLEFVFLERNSYPPLKEYEIAFIGKIAGTSEFFLSNIYACLETDVFQRNFMQLIEA